MTTSNGFRLNAIAGALLAAFAPPGIAAEEEEDITALTRPGSTVSAGVGYATDDARRFGQYNGIKDEGAYLLFDIDFRRRDDETGTWLALRGRNLGLDHRELRFDHNRQGNWGYFLEFGQTPRYEPYTPITGLTGIGTGNQVINGTGLRPVDLKTRRDAISLGGDKIVSGGFEFQVRFKNEEKNGARLYGQGDNPGAPTTRFLTDPIDYTIRQWEAIANYTGERLQLAGGYYGTSFDNHITALNITGAPAAIFNPMALPPGNQSHQLYLGGGYSFTPTTRATFKVAYTHATQTEQFVVPSLTGRTDLGGRVDTSFASVGFTAQPLARLSLLANLRYEDRDDKTPIARYFTGATPTSTLNGDNEPRSVKTIYGKVELGYRLPMGFRLTGGVDYEEKHRNTFPVRVVSHRDRTDETSFRGELRRSIGETLTGAVAYIHSERGGSPFQTTVLNNGSTVGASNLIAPVHLADRTRDKVRASLTWMVTEPATIQFMVDEGRDRYDSRTAADLGVRSSSVHSYTIDGAYVLSDKWQANAWYSLNKLDQDQATVSGATTWASNVANNSHSVGLGVRGKPMTRVDVGADLQYTNIEDRFRVETAGGPAAVSDIPNIRTRITSTQLFARYAIQKNMGVRLNYIFDRWRTNDWTWSQFVYTDGSRVMQNPSQKVHFIGAAAYYNFK
jgi:MtrB/PioB family decaheme-associated outer membrane protein